MHLRQFSSAAQQQHQRLQPQAVAVMPQSVPAAVEVHPTRLRPAAVTLTTTVMMNLGSTTTTTRCHQDTRHQVAVAAEAAAAAEAAEVDHHRHHLRAAHHREVTHFCHVIDSRPGARSLGTQTLCLGCHVFERQHRS